MKTSAKLEVITITALASLPFLAGAADLSQPSTSSATNSAAVAELSPPRPSIWEDGIGSGFVSSAQNLTLEAGVGVGMSAFGSEQAHDLGLLSLSYGHMLGGLVGRDHWYRGNVEGRMELFGGMQYHPEVNTDGWLIGLTPHLRYNFATGTRWVPFFDLGAGVTAMGISRPDVSGTFEFNLQASTGVRYFLSDNLALTSDIRYVHFSCAGTHQPNLGINDVVFMFGVSWFFGK